LNLKSEPKYFKVEKDEINLKTEAGARGIVEASSYKVVFVLGSISINPGLANLVDFA
jgi:hypothetical protein